MAGQATSQEKDRSLPERMPFRAMLGWLLWSMAVAGTLAVLALRLHRQGTSSTLTALSVLGDLVLPALVLAYLVGYLIAPVRHWYIAATPPDTWNPHERASDRLEAWLTHLPMALFGLALAIGGVSVLLTTRNIGARGVFFALAAFGMGVLVFLRSTALGRSMVTTRRGRRWFFGGMALLLVPLYGALVVQALGQFNTGVALSVLGALAVAYSLAISAFTFYGVRALVHASAAQALSGIISSRALEAFKEQEPPLTWWRRHRVLLFAWLPIVIAIGVWGILYLSYRVGLNHPAVAKSGPLVLWSGASAGTLLLLVIPLGYFWVRSYPGLRLHGQLLEAQTWGLAQVTPERRRALAHKMAPAFSVTVLLAGVACGALMNLVDQTGVVSGIQAGLRAFAGPEQASDPGGDVLRWLAGALPDLLVYLGTVVGALAYVSIFLSRPFHRGQLVWRAKMLAAEEERRARLWATLVQRVKGVAQEWGEPDMQDILPVPFPAELSDGMLALVYEVSKERMARYQAVSLHPFGPLGWVRNIGAALLLAVPGFLLNHLSVVGQLFGVK